MKEVIGSTYIENRIHIEKSLTVSQSEALYSRYKQLKIQHEKPNCWNLCNIDYRDN